jgi:hypothetical protein
VTFFGGDGPLILFHAHTLISHTNKSCIYALFAELLVPVLLKIPISAARLFIHSQFSIFNSVSTFHNKATTSNSHPFLTASSSRSLYLLYILESELKNDPLLPLLAASGERLCVLGLARCRGLPTNYPEWTADRQLQV